MLSNLMYVALAFAGHDLRMLFAQVGVGKLTDGLADAAFITHLSALDQPVLHGDAICASWRRQIASTLGASSGWLAEMAPWLAFFLMTTAAALPAMGIMLFLLRRLPPRMEPAADPAIAEAR